jgi:hypothetical protein
MVRKTVVVCLLASLACLVVAQSTTQPASSAPATSTAPAGWAPAYSNDFSKDKLGSEWTVLEGATTQIAEGMLVIKGADADAEVMLKEPKFPLSVKMEFDASLSGETLSDISVILNGDPNGYANAYLLQFGGKANTKTQLIRDGEAVESTIKEKPLVKADQKYHVVAINDGGKISLNIDGKDAFTYIDASPLKGDDHAMIGFYTYGDTLKIDNLKIYRKAGEAAK